MSTDNFDVSPAAHIKKNKDTFWHYAELIRTYDRNHPRNKYKRAMCDLEFGVGKFRRRRIFKDHRTGETRETIEIERQSIG